MNQEEILQKNCINFFRSKIEQKNTLNILKYSREASLKRFFCVNNNSYNAIKGAHNKEMGVVAGVSDMVLITNKCTYFIEFKSEKGRFSKEQKIFAELFENNKSSKYIKIDNYENFKTFIIDLLGEF